MKNANKTAVANAQPRQLYYRHALPVRIMHWVNVVAFFVLLMSGPQIFNAHPGIELGQGVL